MNVRDLQRLIEDLDPNTEVRLMTQSNYPFEYSVEGAVTLDEIHRVAEDLSDEDFFEPANQDSPYVRSPFCGSVLYIVEGTQLGYGTSDAWVAVEG